MYSITVTTIALFNNSFDCTEQKYFMLEMICYFEHLSIGVSTLQVLVRPVDLL